MSSVSTSSSFIHFEGLFPHKSLSQELIKAKLLLLFPTVPQLHPKLLAKHSSTHSFNFGAEEKNFSKLISRLIADCSAVSPQESKPTIKRIKEAS
jgi:hypothetical protein